MIVYDQPDLYGANGQSPWYAAKGSDRRSNVNLYLPIELIERLAEAEKDLGIAVSDLVAAYAERGVSEAKDRQQRMLDTLDDHDRIVGWMPSGTPIERDAR